jgi:hypothetical protein
MCLTYSTGGGGQGCPPLNLSLRYSVIDLKIESGSTEATKIKKMLQRYVIYISDQITGPYLNTETGNRRLNIGGWYVFDRRKGVKI